jgi:predicted deacetylase
MEKKITNYDKGQEMKAIRHLVEMDGYFAEYFKCDLEKMIENIKNDYPIEMDTKIANTIEYFQKRGDDLVIKHTNEIIDLVDTLLCVHEETGNARLYERAVEKIGRVNVIKRKHVIGLKITCNEIDFLLKNVSLNALQQ